MAGLRVMLSPRSAETGMQTMFSRPTCLAKSRYAVSIASKVDQE
jgi:hypothetical protein